MIEFTDSDIRLATDRDAVDLSGLIVRTIRISNAADYPAHLIDRICDNFSPDRIASRFASRITILVVSATEIIGTASLDGRTVRSVFVDPDRQRDNVGRRLMTAIESMARDAGQNTLEVPSSLTAQGFYARLGYRVLRERIEGEERIIVMSKSLSGH
jgi:GNAT superfamily N-acetyltransferase